MIWIGMMIGGLIGGALGVLAARRMEKKRSDVGVAPCADPRLLTERKAPEAVTVRARRDIPLDVWMDRIEQTDAKTAAAQLQVSMAQQIATEAAQHVRVTCCYDPVKKIYEISARLRVVPWREWE